MDNKSVAKALNGREYGEEGTSRFWSDLADAGLVAVFGHSDDCMEFRGAIDDEIEAFSGTTAYVTQSGLFKSECEDADCPYAAKEKDRATEIEALWLRGDGPSWAYSTTIPHETFMIKEDGEPYCEGIVFTLADVPA